MTATRAKWAGVITSAEQLAATCEQWTARPGLPVSCGAAMFDAAQGLLAELANLWTPEEAVVAEVWSLKLTAQDRADFAPWLEKCQQAGAARTMADALRLAVRLASSIPAEQLPKMRAGI